MSTLKALLLSWNRLAVGQDFTVRLGVPRKACPRPSPTWSRPRPSPDAPVRVPRDPNLTSNRHTSIPDRRRIDLEGSRRRRLRGAAADERRDSGLNAREPHISVQRNALATQCALRRSTLSGVVGCGGLHGAGPGLRLGSVGGGNSYCGSSQGGSGSCVPRGGVVPICCRNRPNLGINRCRWRRFSSKSQRFVAGSGDPAFGTPVFPIPLSTLTSPELAPQMCPSWDLPTERPVARARVLHHGGLGSTVPQPRHPVDGVGAATSPYPIVGGSARRTPWERVLRGGGEEKEKTQTNWGVSTGRWIAGPLLHAQAMFRSSPLSGAPRRIPPLPPGANSGDRSRRRPFA